MPDPIEYGRIRDGLIYVDLMKERRDRADEMMKADGLDRSGFFRKLVDDEWERRQKAQSKQSKQAKR